MLPTHEDDQAELSFQTGTVTVSWGNDEGSLVTRVVRQIPGYYPAHSELPTVFGGRRTSGATHGHGECATPRTESPRGVRFHVERWLFRQDAPGEATQTVELDKFNVDQPSMAFYTTTGVHF